MKGNLFLVSYNYDLSKRIAKSLAQEFSLRVFDQRELFDFDNMPRTFSDILTGQGSEFILKKFRSILKMELDFEDSIFISDISFADNCYDLFYKIKLNNFVVFMYKDLEKELQDLKQKKFSTEAEREFFVTDKVQLQNRENLIKNDCADISVDVTGLSDVEIVQKIINQIKIFYS